MTPVSVPADIARFIEQEIASGRYRSQDELVLDAVKVFRALKERHRQLCDDIEQGLLFLFPFPTEVTTSARS